MKHAPILFASRPDFSATVLRSAKELLQQGALYGIKLHIAEAIHRSIQEVSIGANKYPEKVIYDQQQILH